MKKRLHETTAESLAGDLTGFTAGRLPSIQELARRYGVSTLTMWKAVHLLADRGLLHCSHGRRIRVAGPEDRNAETAGAAQWLFRALREEILNGGSRIGRRLPKFDYLVKRHRVSRDTVAQAFRMLAKENLACKRGRAWIAGPAGQQTPSRDSVACRAAAESPVILVLARDSSNWGSLGVAERTRAFSDSFYPEIEQHGILSRIVVIDEGTAPEHVFPAGKGAVADLVNALGERYRGTLIADGHIGADEVREWVPLLGGFDRPVVWFDDTDAGGDLDSEVIGETGRFYRCHVDERAAFGMAVRSLTDLGHREVGIPDPPAGCREWNGRRPRLIEALGDGTGSGCLVRALGAPDDSHRRSERFTSVKDERFLLPLLRFPELTAVLVPGDSPAIEWLLRLERAGIRVPRDLSLLSFGNSGRARSLPLSTIDFGFDQLGYRAAHLFLGDLPVDSDRRGGIAARARLLDRGSLAPPRLSHGAFTARIRELAAEPAPEAHRESPVVDPQKA